MYSPELKNESLKPRIAGLEGGVQVYLPTLSLSLDLKPQTLKEKKFKV